jgi:hypothetical protein
MMDCSAMASLPVILCQDIIVCDYVFAHDEMISALKQTGTTLLTHTNITDSNFCHKKF